MKKAIVSVFLFAAVALAGTDKAQMEAFKKEAAVLRGAIDDAVGSVLPGRSYLDSAKAIYLEGYGSVFTLEAYLGPTHTPFSAPKPAAEIRATVNERRKAITDKLQSVLIKGVPSMQTIAANESVTVVVHLLNADVKEVPDLPSQIQFTVKKEDPSHVIIREY